MTDRQKLVDRGNHAKRLLEDELLVECFDRIEKDIFDEWKLTGVNNYDERTDLFLTLKCLERFRPHRKRYIRRVEANRRQQL